VVCSLTFPQCLGCSATGCTSCSNGYFVNAGNTCSDCPSAITGCLSCSSNSVCTNCDTANSFVLSGSSCVCDSGYTLSATSVCVACTATLPGCLTCTSQSACTSCDIGGNFEVNTTNSSACQCLPGYYLVSLSCVICPTTGTMLGCLECTSSSTCTACDASLHLILSSGNCICSSGYYPDAGGTCQSCQSILGC